MKQKMIIVAAYVLIAGLMGLVGTPANQANAVSTPAPNPCEGLGEQDKEDCIEANKDKNSSFDDCKGPDCCGDVKTSIIKDKNICDASEKEGGMILALLKEVLKFLTAGVGIAAVGGIGYGALLYTTAESKPEQTKKAIGIITNVVIGIAAYALMYVFLNFLIPGGIFS